MPDYDFKTLSPIDFENLARDLMQKEFGVLLESFTPGKDQGIDFRGFISEQNSVIQCKHYAATGYNGLFSTMKNSELSKIVTLSPQRYFLFTSVPLTSKRKSDLFELLQPYVKDQGDIFGKDDINNLLGKHPEIEKKHFKLWLSSISVLENILHSRILRESEQEIDDIIKRSKRYVINESFEEALNILHEYHYFIIAGIPGIGKTMLAKMLALHYINSGYELLSISRDISDAYSIPLHDFPRIYLYDDFLGRASIIEKLEKNEDSRLVSLIERIKDSPRERLILTTREYILHQAQNVYERLDAPIFEKPQCIVDLSSYTRKMRASILYNHLYFSDIGRDHVQSLIQDSTYLDIIDHANFNPRIIDNLTNRIWISDILESDYPSFFKNALYDQSVIWKKVFRSQVSKYARLILTILTSLPSEVFLEDVKSIFINHVQNRSFPHDIEIVFHDALRELEGNFTITHKLKKGILISFHNPSIADFMEREIENSPLALFDILKYVKYFEQIEFILDSDSRHRLLLDNFAEAKSLLKEKIVSLVNKSSCKLIYIAGVEEKKYYKARSSLGNKKRFGYLASKAANKNYSYLLDVIQDYKTDLVSNIQQGTFRPEDLTHLLRHLIPLPVLDKDEKRNLLLLAKESMIENANWISQIEDIFEFYKLYPHMQSSEDNNRIHEKAASIVDDVLSDDYELLDSELYHLKNIKEKYQVNFSKEIDDIEHRISELEDELKSSPDPEWEGEHLSPVYQKDISNQEINNMFITLTDVLWGRAKLKL
jgi:hypothetical protein